MNPNINAPSDHNLRPDPGAVARLPEPPASSGDVGLVYRLRLFVEVTEAGRPFYEAEVQSKTFDQSRDGVVALNQTIVDMLQAQADLGRKAAEAHAGRADEGQ